MQEALIGRLDEFKTAQSDTLRDGQTIDKVPEGFRRPVEAWISAPSRLAFVMNNGPIGLTVTELTAWESFELRVVQRARRLYSKPKELIEESSPAKILADQGIKTWDKTGAERVSEIVGTMQKPGDFDTALEIPTGLILSPAQDALWITPKKLPPRLDGSPNGTPPTPLWQAILLERQKKSSLRAVWSQHFDTFAVDTFSKATLPKDKLELLEKWQAPNGTRYRTAMSPQDQAELVALTSMYGLPVIASKDTEVSSQIEPPSDDGKKYITDADPDPKSPYAIYMPVPLQARRLALGATDASRSSGRAACGYRLLAAHRGRDERHRRIPHAHRRATRAGFDAVDLRRPSRRQRSGDDEGTCEILQGRRGRLSGKKEGAGKTAGAAKAGIERAAKAR